MAVQGAEGSVDLLAPAAARRRALVDALIDTFETWGYRQVVTPTVERYDVLAAGLSPDARAHVVRFVSGPTSQVVALRSDVTPQIARMVAQHRGTTWAADAVLRLSYTADVVRQTRDAGEKAEHHQVGVEFVGDASPAADAELVALAHAALVRVGLTGFRFDLSHAGVANGALAALDISPERRAQARKLLARKDRHNLRSALIEAGAEPSRAEAVASLCDAYGHPQVIEQARGVEGVRGIDGLAAIVAHVRAVHPDAADVLDVDLGEVRGFDYYTGARLRAWAPGVPMPVLRGGRYDDLVGRLGASAPATGFALDLDALEEAVAGRGPQPASRARHLVALHPDCDPAVRIEASRRAAQARAANEAAWVRAEITIDRARTIAAEAGADRITYLQPDESGQLAVLHLRREDTQWTTQ